MRGGRNKLNRKTVGFVAGGAWRSQKKLENLEKEAEVHVFV